MQNMADNDLDLDQLDLDIEKDNKVEKRIKDLSEKVKLTAQERDEKNNLLGERDKKIAELERENAFNSGFADVLGTHSAAKDHKDEIKAKVLSGYSVEDATFAVLGKVGKLGFSQPKPIVDNPAGGSAPTQLPDGGSKTLNQFTRDEKRAELLKAQERGELSVG